MDEKVLEALTKVEKELQDIRSIVEPEGEKHMPKYIIDTEYLKVKEIKELFDVKEVTSLIKNGWILLNAYITSNKIKYVIGKTLIN